MSEKIKRPINKDALIIWIVVAVLILAVVGILCYYFIFANNEVVVTYDGGKVTRGEYELYYRAFGPVLTYYGYPTNVAVEYIAEKIVLDKIIMQKATEAGYELTEEEKADVEESFQNKTLLEQYTSYGVDLDALKKLFYEDAIISRYIDDMEEKVTSDEVKAYIDETEGSTANYNKYATRHILVSLTSSSTDEEIAKAESTAQDILKKVLAGENFTTLVQTYSEDSNNTGDDAGVVNATTGNVEEEYINAVLTLKEGQIYSSIVKSSYGYHIIKLEEIEQNGRLTDDTEKGYVVNSKLSDMQDAVNIEFKSRLYSLAKNIGVELGIIDATEEVKSTKSEVDNVTTGELVTAE